MPTRFIEPFDFESIYITYFLGNQLLFAFAFILLVSFVSARMQIPNRIFLVILTIGSIMFGGYMGQAIYTLILFIFGFIIYKIFSRVLQ